MDERETTVILAVGILLMVLPIPLLARAVARGRLTRRASGVARTLGLELSGPLHPKSIPMLEGVDLLRPEEHRSIAHPMRGDYRGRDVLLAEFLEASAAVAGGWRSRAVLLLASIISVLAMLGGIALVITASEIQAQPVLSPTDRRLVMAFRLLGYLLIGLGASTGAVLLLRLARQIRMASSHLLILFADPVPGLPEFLLTSEAVAGLAPGSGVPSGTGVDDFSATRQIGGRVALPGSLPIAFIERAGRVLAGRPLSWTVQGTGGRLAVRIAEWRFPADSRTARSYRAVLDDAISLREALEPWESSDCRVGPPSGREGLREALDRIRSERGRGRGGGQS